MAKSPNRKKAEKLAARDGKGCWLCGEPVDFGSDANTALAWSVEHLLGRNNPERGSLDNLVLCHPPCNQRLRDLPLTQKIALRDEHRRARWAERVAATLLQL